MARENAEARTFFTLAGLLIGSALALLLPGAASAMPMAVGEDVSDCFTVQQQEGMPVPDGDGNYWARRDTFTLSECSFAQVTGISIVLKTPFQIANSPDDLDTGADFAAMQTQMEMDFPEFIPDFGGEAYFNDPVPVAPANEMFAGARICIDETVASCMAGSPLSLNGIGFMIFTIDLPQSIFLCDDSGSTSGCEGEPNSFDLVTFADSELTGLFDNGNGQMLPQLPELIVGWRLVQLVPEPSLAALLLPVLVAGALRRR